MQRTDYVRLSIAVKRSGLPATIERNAQGITIEIEGIDPNRVYREVGMTLKEAVYFWEGFTQGTTRAKEALKDVLLSKRPATNHPATMYL